MSPNKTKIKECVTNILGNILKLSKLKVPVAITFHHLGKTQQFGTKFAREELSSIEAELKTALEKDALNLCSVDSNEPLLTTNIELTDKDRALHFFKELFKVDKFPELPATLELL